MTLKHSAVESPGGALKNTSALLQLNKVLTCDLKTTTITKKHFRVSPTPESDLIGPRWSLGCDWVIGQGSEPLLGALRNNPEGSIRPDEENRAKPAPLKHPCVYTSPGRLVWMKMLSQEVWSGTPDSAL